MNYFENDDIPIRHRAQTDSTESLMIRLRHIEVVRFSWNHVHRNNQIIFTPNITRL